MSDKENIECLERNIVELKSRLTESKDLLYEAMLDERYQLMHFREKYRMWLDSVEWLLK